MTSIARLSSEQPKVFPPLVEIPSERRDIAAEPRHAARRAHVGTRPAPVAGRARVVV